MILLLVHWALTPIACSLSFPRAYATFISFSSIFVIWCIHFNALDLEFPFGTRENDIPMTDMQSDWNKSLCTLLAKRAQRPPEFTYHPVVHDILELTMSDGSELDIPGKTAVVRTENGARITARRTSRTSGTANYRASTGSIVL